MNEMIKEEVEPQVMGKCSQRISYKDFDKKRRI